MTTPAAVTALTTNATAASARGLLTKAAGPVRLRRDGTRGLPNLVASLSTLAAADAIGTTTLGAIDGEACTSETNPESESTPAAVLSVLLACLDSEMTRKESGRRVKGIFLCLVELGTDPTFMLALHHVKLI